MTATLVTADPVALAVVSLASCLSDQLEGTGRATCFCGVLPGAAIPMDVGGCYDGSECSNGMAYTRLVNIYASVSVGQAIVAPANCNAGIGFDIEIGIYRCFPLEDDGTSPPPDVLTEAFLGQLADAAAMRAAVGCCDWGLEASDFIVGTYAPIGPEGGVLGGSIPLSAWLP